MSGNENLIRHSLLPASFGVERTAVFLFVPVSRALARKLQFR